MGLWLLCRLVGPTRRGLSGPDEAARCLSDGVDRGCADHGRSRSSLRDLHRYDVIVLRFPDMHRTTVRVVSTFSTFPGANLRNRWSGASRGSASKMHPRYTCPRTVCEPTSAFPLALSYRPLTRTTILVFQGPRSPWRSGSSCRFLIWTRRRPNCPCVGRCYPPVPLLPQTSRSTGTQPPPPLAYYPHLPPLSPRHP